MIDPQLVLMKDLADKITRKGVRSKNNAAIASVRTALQVYLVVRGLAKKHYGG